MIRTWQKDLDPDTPEVAFDLTVPEGEKWRMAVVNIAHEGEGAAHVELFVTPVGGQRHLALVVSGTEPTMREPLYTMLDAGERIEVVAEARFHDHPCFVSVGLSWDRQIATGHVTVDEIVTPVRLDPESVIEGPPGPEGPMGPAGATTTVSGIKRWYGEGPPTVVVGSSPGDEYLDRLTGDLYILE